MVKKSYQPVYHPGNYAFGKSRAIDNGAVVLEGAPSEVLADSRLRQDYLAV